MRGSSVILSRQANAQQYYAPINQMMQSMYGTQGIQAPQTPGVPGSKPAQQGNINQMMGRR